MADKFSLFGQIFADFDEVVNQLVVDNIAKISEVATPVIALGLTIALLIFGLQSMLNPNGEPLTDLIKRFIRYGTIISIASVGGLYQTTLANVAMKTPDEVANVLVINSDTSHDSDTTFAQQLDDTINSGCDTIKQMWDASSIFTSEGLSYLCLAFFLAVTLIVMMGIAAALILVAKVSLAIVVSLGSIFIYSLLFQSTKRLFDRWISSIISYGLVLVLLSSVFGLVLSYYRSAMKSLASIHETASSISLWDMVTGSNQVTEAAVNNTILSGVISCAFISILAVLLMFEVPKIAMQLGGGIAAMFPSASQAGRAAASLGGNMPMPSNNGSNSQKASAGSSSSETSKGVPMDLGSNQQQISNQSSQQLLLGYARGSNK